jgi:hypothetical protein
MRVSLFFVLAMTLAVDPVPAFADRIVGNDGGWNILVSDAYQGCVARASYRDGTIVTFGVDGISNERFINFSNRAWDYPINQTYQVDFDMAGMGRFSGYFHTVLRDNTTTFENGELGDKFISTFEAAAGMSMLVEGKHLTNFSLLGTSAAFSAVFQCENTLRSE